MARRKINKSETDEEIKCRKEMEAVVAIHDRNEKLSWKRSHEKMNSFLQMLEPIEEEIIALQVKKIPLMDKIEILRLAMVKTCVHPFELLIHKDDHILCKFCEKKISIPKIKKSESHGVKKL